PVTQDVPGGGLAEELQGPGKIEKLLHEPVQRFSMGSDVVCVRAAISHGHHDSVIILPRGRSRTTRTTRTVPPLMHPFRGFREFPDETRSSPYRGVLPVRPSVPGATPSGAGEY